MHHAVRTAVFALLVLLAGSAFAETTPAQREDERGRTLQQAIQLALDQHQPAAAVALLEPLIGQYHQHYSALAQRPYCPRTDDEGDQYVADGLRQARADTVMLTDQPTWAYALYYKGYALIDLGRIDEARAALEQALWLAPRNAQFLSELAITYQREGNWERMLALSSQAVDAASFSPPQLRDDELGRALRSKGYALFELAQLDAAAQAYRQALQINPGDQDARDELTYILARQISP